MTDFDKSKVKKGDFITVSRKYRVTRVNEFGFAGLLVDHRDGGSEAALPRSFGWDEEETLTHEPAPVEVFKAGDVVRRKGNGTLYTLGQDPFSGRKFYTYHNCGSTVPYSTNDLFTSEYYERVEL